MSDTPRYKMLREMAEDHNAKVYAVAALDAAEGQTNALRSDVECHKHNHEAALSMLEDARAEAAALKADAWSAESFFLRHMATDDLTTLRNIAATYPTDGPAPWVAEVAALREAASVPEDKPDEREAFEAWCVQKFLDYAPLDVDAPTQTYEDTFTQHLWCGWQARAALDAAPEGKPAEREARS